MTGNLPAALSLREAAEEKEQAVEFSIGLQSQEYQPATVAVPGRRGQHRRDIGSDGRALVIGSLRASADGA